ncbi:unnamed protein product [Orchesella dallaii]|uniref:Carboxylic ester hydrolase n=1 Tax=Orchesella dallaii TaxID=48710 RepID=A0ABP1PQW8_9HEXA
MLKRFRRVYTFVTYCCPFLIGIVSPCMSTFSMYAPVVNTSLGRVRGIVDNSRELRRFYQYIGIKYAESPEGDLRFEAPVPIKPWSEIYQATSWPSPCLQFDAILKGRVLGKEDCLYLNIFTRNVTPKELYPVLVWVHGGGFVAGSSDMYDPKYFMDHDVVVVSMNYRLASLGFLNTGDELIRGNMGLKDQNLVLRFVKDNIKNFGGDPNRVTLLGESAGAASVHYHIVSPLSRGLFHRAIMQSGNIFCPWAHTRSPGNQAMGFGKSLGCPTDNTTVLVECLRNMDGKTIVKQHAAILSPVHTQDDFFPGSVEAVIRNDTFLAENPFMMLKRGDFNRVPVIFGMNSGEGALKTARMEAHRDVLTTLDSKWHDHVSILLHYNTEMKNVSQKLRNFYCPQCIFPTGSNSSESVSNSTPSEVEGGDFDDPDAVPPHEALENVTHMVSDGVWFLATKEAAMHHAKYAPVYLNYFSYISNVLPSSYTFIKSARVRNNVPAEWSWPRYLAQAYLQQHLFQNNNPKRFGACHGDDLIYYFATNPIMQIRQISQDYTFSKNIVAAFVHFVSEASPLKFGHSIWEPVNDPNNLRYLRLDGKPEMIDQPSCTLFSSLNPN